MRVEFFACRKESYRCKWVYKMKLKPHGTIGRYKAGLVTNGYNQVAGEDFSDSFSPVAKSVTVRLFLVVVASITWSVHQLDINNAFLHGFIDE